jgi:hypothetical protein
MAHFAQINDENIVVNVLVVPDEQEHRGHEFLANDLGLGGRWVQTSYNHRIRGHYAGIGHTYDETLDLFIAPKPFPSWVMLPNGWWDSPKPRPIEGAPYDWDETNQEWVPVE